MSFLNYIFIILSCFLTLTLSQDTTKTSINDELSSFNHLIDLIASRMALGMDIAHYKYTHNITIYGLRYVQREEEVIQAMLVLADQFKLDPDWTKMFFSKQMFTNNMIQAHFYKQWMNGTKLLNKHFTPDLSVLRKTIDRINYGLLFNAKKSLTFRQSEQCFNTLFDIHLNIAKAYEFDREMIRLYKTYALADVCLPTSTSSTTPSS